MFNNLIIWFNNKKEEGYKEFDEYESYDFENNFFVVETKFERYYYHVETIERIKAEKGRRG